VTADDTTSVTIEIQSMMFGQNRQPACEARFTDKELVITTQSGLTGMCNIGSSSSSSSSSTGSSSRHGMVHGWQNKLSVWVGECFFLQPISQD